MKTLTNYLFECDSSVERHEGKSVTYISMGEGLKDRSYVADGTESVTTSDYLVLDYCLSGVKRLAQKRQSIISGVCGTEEQGLLFLNEMIVDGQKHRLIMPCERNTYDFLRLNLQSRSPKLKFEIYSFYTCTYEELPKRFESSTYEGDYACIDIEALCNARVSTEPSMIDSGVTIPVGKVGVQGIPFCFPQDNRMLRPDAGPIEENEEIIKNFTATVKRGLCRPVSRASRITVSVDRKASEIYFVLYMDGKIYERIDYCAPDTTILGQARDEVFKPICVNDIERFAILVEYEDGMIDECFPQNVKTGRHEIMGETGVYGVPLHNKKVVSISFETRMRETDISLLAVTCNTDAPKRLLPMFAERKREAEKQFNKKPVFELDEDILRFQNGGFVCEIDTLKGLWVKETKSAFCNGFRMSGAMLKIRDGDEIVDCFERISIEAGEKEAVAVFRYENLKITTYFRFYEQDGIVMQMEAENCGDTDKRVGILFPVLDDVCYRTPVDTWYFLPKYQNTESNGTCYVYEESAPSYPMQFMDLFSPTEGAGLALLTRERETKTRKYALIKQDGITQAFIEYPSMYGNITPQSVFKGSETVMFVHSGDWHAAYADYKKWLRTWYEPYKCQNKLWYRQKFWLLAEIIDFIENTNVYNLPVWYDKETKTYRFKEIMKEISELYGETPDILHLWAWTWSSNHEHMLWGNFGESDYERIGGLENFRNALYEVSEETGAEISLYMHPTLLSDVYPQTEEYWPQLKVKNEAGNYITCLGDSWRMCHANRTWRNYVLDMYKRVYKDIGTRLFYVDEFSLRTKNRCFSDEHGHPVPSNLLKTDREFISALRDETPEDIVLYGEYYAADINARYIDCNISYYILDSINNMIENGVHAGDGSDIYGRVFTDIYRFAFPKIVQLILPMAMRNETWHPLKATFFNGEAVYDSFWDAEETKGREFMAHSYRIKKHYADCFSSDEPETMIEGVSDAICINRFPGIGRTVYTLYNRSYHTYQGDVLCVPYREGAEYRDVWNDKEVEVTVQDGFAYVSTTITAQAVGAIVEILKR